MKQADLGIDRKETEWLHVNVRLTRPDAERVRKLMDDPRHAFTFFGQACRYLVQKGLEAEGL